MTEKEFAELIDKYRAGRCTKEEEAQLESWFNDFARKSSSGEPVADFSAVDISIRERLEIAPAPVVRKIPIYKRLAVAATIAFGLITSGIVYYSYHKTQFDQQNPTADKIQPGGNKATLTLANGKTITLSDSSGLLAAMMPGSGVVISNNAHSGIVTFKFDSNSGEGVNPKKFNEVDEDQAVSNKISTPTGGQYQLVLSDGTRVYLNAASTIVFPARFAGKSRSVSLSGEGYFEVAKDPNHPFIVTTKDQTVTVLGTQFNVNAYSGEPVKTTLSEGSVRLSTLSSSQTQILKPNQQAVLLSNRFDVRDIDATEAIAWKDGVFKFMETPLAEAMQQIGRWYNVEIGKDIPDTPLTSIIPRDLNLQQVLTKLQRLGFTFNYKTNERRLIFVK